MKAKNMVIAMVCALGVCLSLTVPAWAAASVPLQEDADVSDTVELIEVEVEPEIVAEQGVVVEEPEVVDGQDDDVEEPEDIEAAADDNAANDVGVDIEALDADDEAAVADAVEDEVVDESVVLEEAVPERAFMILMAPKVAEQSNITMKGWNKIGSDWYWSDDGKNPRTGWVKDGSWYYLDPANQGRMMANRVFRVDGNLYVAKPSGACPENEWVKIGSGWYLTNGSCAVRTGWVQDGGTWYYLDPAADGRMKSNEVFADSDGKLYVAKASGACPTSAWVKIGSGWYLTDSSCAVLTDWVQVRSVWYYLDPAANGRMKSNEVFTASDGKLYVAKASGACPADSWVKIGADWYLTNGSCAVRTGFATSRGVLYYLDPASDGRMKSAEIFKVKGKLYIAKESGALPAYSWVKLAGKSYLTNGDSVVRTGWVDTADGRYYLDPKASGRMAVGEKTIDKQPYFFKKNGVMAASEWVTLADGSSRFAAADGVLQEVERQGGSYTDGDGNLYKGWVKAGSDWFYYDGKSTKPLKGLKTIDGVKYLLDSKTGAQKFGWQSVNGKAQFFDPYSEPHPGALAGKEEYLLSVARDEVGNTDGSKYWQNSYGWSGGGYDWCAVFVTDILKRSGIDAPYYPNTFAFDERDMPLMDGRKVTKNKLSAGDIVAFDWLEPDGPNGEMQRNGAGDHVGFIIEKIDDKTYRTVEGNTLNEKGQRSVAIKERTTDDIVCGIKPYYNKFEPVVK